MATLSGILFRSSTTRSAHGSVERMQEWTFAMPSCLIRVEDSKLLVELDLLRIQDMATTTQHQV